MAKNNINETVNALLESVNTLAKVSADLVKVSNNHEARLTALESGKAIAPSAAKQQKSSTTKTKTSSKKSSTKSRTSKKSDDFDYSLYEAIAKKAGCYGKHGCWKQFRQNVYDIMDLAEADRPKAITKLAKDVKAYAKANF